MLISCPSGLSFHARHWKLKDQRSLLETKEGRESILPRRMVELASLPEGVEDPGPYPFSKGDSVDWDRVSQPDLVTANIQIRIATDPMLNVTRPCESCGRRPEDIQLLDLRELKVTPASDEGKEHLRSGAPVEREIDGVIVHLKSILCKDLSVLSRLQEEDAPAMLEVQCCMSIQQLKGPNGVVTGMIPIRDFWGEQSWGFQEAVEEAVDDLFGGTESFYEWTCPRIECRIEQESVVPLDPGFYGMELRRKRRKRQKPSSAMKSAKKTMPEASTG